MSESLKKRIFVAYTVVVSLVAIAGIVFFILFLVQASSVKKYKKRCDIMQQNLTSIRTAQMYSGDQTVGAPEKHRFISHVDGLLEEYACMTPAALGAIDDNVLVVYLHGMGSSALEPFVSPKNKTIYQAISEKQPEAIVLSLPYRASSSWLNDAALADVDQNIKEVLQRYPIKKIIIMGTSMGGISSLAYSALACPEVKSKIVGVVSSEGSGDLLKVYETTSTLVKNGMLTALGDPAVDPAPYERRSLIKHLREVPRTVKYAIISSTKDHVIKPILQKEMVEALEKDGYQAKLIEIEDQHGVPDARVYAEGLEYVLQ